MQKVTCHSLDKLLHSNAYPILPLLTYEARHFGHHYRQNVYDFVLVWLPCIPILKLGNKIAHDHAGEKAICKILYVALIWHHLARKPYWHLCITASCPDKRFQLLSITVCQTHYAEMIMHVCLIMLTFFIS